MLNTKIHSCGSRSHTHLNSQIAPTACQLFKHISCRIFSLESRDLEGVTTRPAAENALSEATEDDGMAKNFRAIFAKVGNLVLFSDQYSKGLRVDSIIGSAKY